MLAGQKVLENERLLSRMRQIHTFSRKA